MHRAVFAVMLVASCKPSTKGPGNPQAAWFAREGGQLTLILSDEISTGRSSYDSRLAAIDVKTGAKLAVRGFDPRVTLCATAADGGLWCDVEGTMRRLDARTLKDVTTTAATPPMPSYMMRKGCDDGSSVTVGEDKIELHSDTFERIGTKTWKVPLEGSGCHAYALVDDLLVVAVGDNRARALGIDVATGAVRWSVKF